MMPEKKLLILDLDETLIHATQTPLERPAEFRVGPYAVYRRPHLELFLAQCLGWFEVAVWSSSSPLYAREVVQACSRSHRSLPPFGRGIAARPASTTNYASTAGAST